MGDYISLYFQSALENGTPEGFVSVILLGLGRLLPIIQLSPFFGSRTLPMPAKIALGLSFLVILFPSILANLTSPLFLNSYLMLMFAKELFIGFAIGMIMSAPFLIVQNVGVMIDHQRGGASLMVNDPTIQNQSSPLGTLYNLILISLFYFVDGPFYFLDAISTSYQLLPVDRLLSPAFFNQETTFWKQMITYMNSVMVISVQLVAPPLIVTLMTDMFLGIVNRLAPQVQIIFLGMPLKSLLALFMIWLGWKAYNEQSIVVLFQWLDFLKKAMYSFTLTT